MDGAGQGVDPVLVAAAVAGVELDGVSAGGLAAGVVKAHSAHGDGAVGLEGPLLRAGAVAGVGLDRVAVGGGAASVVYAQTGSKQDIRTMINIDPAFRRSINSEVKRGSFDSGWRSSSIQRDIGNAKTPMQSNYYFALNGYQYRVYGSSAGGSERVTVDVFKRYNWGNPVGGAHRGNLGPGGLISQNGIAQLNADGHAWDFNVWGAYTYETGAG